MGVLLSIKNADFSANSISGLDSVKKVKWYIDNSENEFDIGLGFSEGNAWSDKDHSALVGKKTNIVRIYVYSGYNYQNLKLYKIGNGQSTLIKENIVANQEDVKKGFFDVIFDEQIISEGEHLCVTPTSGHGGMYYSRDVENAFTIQFNVSTGLQVGSTQKLQLGWSIGYVCGV